MGKAVTIKWGTKKLSLEIDLGWTGKELKEAIQKETGVPVERQMITGVGKGMLENDTKLSDVKIKKKIQVVGTADIVPEKASKKIVFAEDMVENEEELSMKDYPSGLTNLMNTCYLASAVQVLRKVDPIRETLEKYKGSSSSMRREEKVTSCMRDLFRQFEKSNGYPVTPAMFVQAVRTSYPELATMDDSPMGKIYQQQDADEFMGKVKQALKQELTKVDPSIASLFDIKLKVELQNSETEGEKETKTEFADSLKCMIKTEIKHVERGLEEGLKGTTRQTSKKLGRSAIWTRQAKIAELPEYLLVNYVRFEWKEKDKVFCKILKPIRYGMQLDVADLCTEELRSQILGYRRSKLEADNKRMEEKRRELTKEVRMEDDHVEEEQDENEMKDDVAHETGQYELIGIVTHKGLSVNSGHYVGWTKQSNSKWMMFDDDKVRESTEKEIKELCGGGNNHIAYISLYRKVPANL